MYTSKHQQLIQSTTTTKNDNTNIKQQTVGQGENPFGNCNPRTTNSFALDTKQVTSDSN